MKYKGRNIQDHCYVSKSKGIDEYWENSVDFTVEDLDTWKKAVEEKTAELTAKGVEFKYVGINIHSDGWHYNPDGPDDESFMNVYVTWLEMETEEEREERIRRAKKDIDEKIEAEKRAEEAKEIAKQREMERAINMLQNAGYRVY